MKRVWGIGTLAVFAACRGSGVDATTEASATTTLTWSDASTRGAMPNSELPSTAGPVAGSISSSPAPLPGQVVFDADAGPSAVSQKAMSPALSPTKQTHGRPCCCGHVVQLPSVHLGDVRASGSL